MRVTEKGECKRTLRRGDWLGREGRGGGGEETQQRGKWKHCWVKGQAREAALNGGTLRDVKETRRGKEQWQTPCLFPSHPSSVFLSSACPLLCVHPPTPPNRIGQATERIQRMEGGGGKGKREV